MTKNEADIFQVRFQKAEVIYDSELDEYSVKIIDEIVKEVINEKSDRRIDQ